MGAPSKETHKPGWLLRKTDDPLKRLQGELQRRTGRPHSQAEALDEAVRIALAELTETPKEGAER